MVIKTSLLAGVFIGTLSLSNALPPIIPSLENHFAASRISLAQNRNAIIGHVFDTSRRPVGQVFVELQDDYYSSIARARTDESGFYAFNGIPFGSYYVTVQAYGNDYVAQTERVQIETLSRSGARSSQSVQLDFTLKKKNENKPAIKIRNGVVFAQEIPEAARKFYEQAVTTLDSRKGDEAGLEGLRKAIGIFPNYFLALERLGLEYLKREQFSAARDVLVRAVGVNARGDQSLYGLGIAQYALKDTSAAVDSLSRAVAVTPASINYQMWYGKALWKIGRLDEAEIHFKRSYALGSNRIPVVHLYLAQLYDRQKRYREEANELELYLKEEPAPNNAEKIKEAIGKLKQKTS